MPAATRQAPRNAAPPKPPLSPKVARALREAWWLVMVAVAFYLALAFISYDRGDPGWSHSGSHGRIQNLGGEVGAYLADLLLYLLGMSAWWLVILAVASTFWGYRRISAELTSDRRSVAIAGVGFLIALLASSAMENLRLHSLVFPLPLAPGGMIGAALGDSFSGLLGFTGATLIFIAAFAAGVTLATGLSWLTACERTGFFLERTWVRLKESVVGFCDRRIGRDVAREREESVVEEKRRIETAQPLRIEAPPPVQVSERRVLERQAKLFADLPDSPLPPLTLLDEAAGEAEAVNPETLEFTSRAIERKLMEFGVEVSVLAAQPGPVITRYEVEPAPGVKGAQVVGLMKDLARALSVVSIRVVETVQGRHTMALEMPNTRRQMVHLSEILGAKVYADNASLLTLALGKDIGGHPVVADLAKMPHVLVAGTTGSGKSVAINAMILSLLYRAEPSQVRLILVDPKMLELSVYDGIPHLAAPVVTDMKLAAAALNWCVGEMERRFRLMSTVGVRNLTGFNHKIAEAAKAGQPLMNPLLPEAPEPLVALPFLVVVIDELADLMMVCGKKVEELIARLAQKARAAGIHLILATQRPSVDVITGLIKANIPTRIAFQVSSKVDSRTILDQMGAEVLLGQGDMLYLPPGAGRPQRVHGAFVSDAEVHRVVDFLKQQGAPQYVEGVLEVPEEGAAEEGGAPDGEADPLYDDAVALVMKTRRASISAVQRHMRIGYNRAARLIESMERAGLVSPMQSNGNRDVLAPSHE